MSVETKRELTKLLIQESVGGKAAVTFPLLQLAELLAYTVRLEEQVTELQKSNSELMERARGADERAAWICEATRPHGGRAWTEGQAAAFEVLTVAAERIRDPSNQKPVKP